MIEVDHLTKRYGAITAVDDISFEVGKGEIVGFLGPNGAGKTTTMRVLTCFLPATEGTARIGGYDIFESPLEVKRRIGYLPELPPLYRDMRVHTYLKFIAKIKGVAPSEAEQRIDAVIAQCGLVDRVHQLIGQLSKGYRQRVGLAQAILHDPEVIIMDEPTSGLDPNQIIEVRQLIRELAHERTVILSTHILPEVEMTCNRVIIIHEGKIVAVDTPGKSHRRYARHSAVFRSRIGRCGCRGRGDSQDEGVGSVVRSGHGLRVHWPADANLSTEVSARVVALGMGLVEMREEAMSLEETFHALTTQEAELMGHVMAIFGKEMRSYFGSPIAYVMGGVFLLFSGFVFRNQVLEFRDMSVYLQLAERAEKIQLNVNTDVVEPFFEFQTFIWMIVIPMLTMRLYAEEKRGGTYELLMTSPITSGQILMGKFLACYALYLLIEGMAFGYIGVLAAHAQLDWGPVFSGALGVVLIGATFISVGIWRRL